MSDERVREALTRADMQLQMLHGVNCTDVTFDCEYIANNKEQRELIKEALLILAGRGK